MQAWTSPIVVEGLLTFPVWQFCMYISVNIWTNSYETLAELRTVTTPFAMHTSDKSKMHSTCQAAQVASCCWSFASWCHGSKYQYSHSSSFAFKCLHMFHTRSPFFSTGGSFAPRCWSGEGFQRRCPRASLLNFSGQPCSSSCSPNPHDQEISGL
jgi:hypothetical protein